MPPRRPIDTEGVRVAVLLPQELNRAVEICAASQGKQKKQLVADALTLYLEKNNFSVKAFPQSRTASKSAKP